MVLDSIANAGAYRALGPRIAAGLDFLAAFDLALGEGRHPIQGDELFALVQRYHTAPGADRRFESHRRYVDVQFVAEGRERILVAPAAALEEEEPYAEESDVAFHREPGASSSLLLRAGDFAILFPGDAHKPGCMAGGREAVLKVVIKARL